MSTETTCTDWDGLELEEMHAALRPRLEELGERFGELAGLRPLGGPPAVADATTKAAVISATGSCVAVIICASPESPSLVARGVSNAARAKQALGERLGSVILDPLGAAEVGGLTFVILPYRPPLSAWRVPWMLQKQWLVPRVLEWIHQVAAVSTSEATGAPDFVTPLLHCEGQSALRQEVRHDAATALERLSRGEWRPRHSLDHNDLWKDNILSGAPGGGRAKGDYPFTLIDWVGANINGFGFYDLVRLCNSMKIEGARFRREVARHCAALACDPGDAMGHLLASLGWLGMNLEHFPLSRYVGLVERCWKALKSVESGRLGRGDAPR